MWEKIKCFLLGHDWRGPSGRVPKGLLLPQDFKRIICIRCETMFYELAEMREAMVSAREVEEDLQQRFHDARVRSGK